MTSKYKQIHPEGMFKATVERTIKHDSREKMHYEYSYTVEIAPCTNDFLTLFAKQVTLYGSRRPKFYAPIMGAETGLRLTTTLQTLSGVVEVRDWTDAFASALTEALLSETNWGMDRIAKAAHFYSPAAFSRFFQRTHDCTPKEWRAKTQDEEDWLEE